MVRVPGLNFRNVLLCLAIVLQLLTYMKHEGYSVVNLPAPLPIGSSLGASDSSAERSDTASSKQSGSSASISGSLVSAGQRSSGGSTPVSPDRLTERLSGEATLEEAAPMESGTRTAGIPAGGHSGPSRPAIETVSAGSAEATVPKAEPGEPSVPNTDPGDQTTQDPPGDPSPPPDVDPEPGGGDEPEVIIE
jgi:hypothetical protein